jgi:hypothetical protein
MPQYVVERQYLVPVYEYILVEAASLDEACGRAVDDCEEPWGDNTQTDYENARATTIERVVELPAHVEAKSGDDRGLSHLLYDAGLTPLTISREFTEDDERQTTPVGFV